jgi:hypothetical protein
MVNWTQILLAIISTIGTVASAIFASRAKGSAASAVVHAEVARQASLMPGPDRPTPVDGIARANAKA